MFILDSHCDTPSELVRGRNMFADSPESHVDFPKLRRGEVDGAFFALYVPADMDTDEAYAHALKMSGAVKNLIEAAPDRARLAVSANEALENKSKGLFSIFLGLENGSPIGKSMDRLHEFYDSGVRYMTLCHSRDNQICDSCASAESKWHGLSPFGKEVIAAMNSMGMLVDVSHISDKSFYDVLECSSKPVVAPHSCCRKLADHPRNMTDEMIRALASAGGVIQINFYPVFLDSSFTYSEGMDMSARPSYRSIADHIDHVVSLVGTDHVGIGSDFDGIEVTPKGMEDISMMPVLFDELRKRGYSEADLEKIASGNFFRVMSCQ